MAWHPNLTKPCAPGCTCGKHNRTRMHNQLIGKGVSRAHQEKLAQQEEEGRNEP